MARSCSICGKHSDRGRMYTRRGIAKKKGGIGKKTTGKTRRSFAPNLHTVRTFVDGKATRIRLCATCVKSGVVVKPPRAYKPAEPVAAAAAPATSGAPAGDAPAQT